MTMNTITKKQHFIPQTYLRGFSYDTINVYAYRIIDGFQPADAVKIESICYKKYLYEVRDENDIIIKQNQVEKCFCGIEGAFSRYREQLQKMAFIKSNYQSTQFLRRREIDFWKYYIAIQILRVPQVLEIAETVAENEFPIPLKKNQARAFALDGCLSFPEKGKKLPVSVLSMYLESFDNMSIAVGVDETDSIFTSDFPVYAFSPTKSYDNAEKIVFPLTSKLVIYLFGGQQKTRVRKNCLFPIDADELKSVKQSIAYAANDWIYSKMPLSAEEKQIITMAHADKTQNENNQESI